MDDKDMLNKLRVIRRWGRYDRLWAIITYRSQSGRRTLYTLHHRDEGFEGFIEYDGKGTAYVNVPSLPQYALKAIRQAFYYDYIRIHTIRTGERLPVHEQAHVEQ